MKNLILIFLIAIVGAGCGGNEQQNNDYSMRLVTTVHTRLNDALDTYGLDAVYSGALGMNGRSLYMAPKDDNLYEWEVMWTRNEFAEVNEYTIIDDLEVLFNVSIEQESPSERPVVYMMIDNEEVPIYVNSVCGKIGSTESLSPHLSGKSVRQILQGVAGVNKPAPTQGD